MADSEVTTGEKLASLRRVLAYRPLFALFIVAFSLFTTLLEGVGLTFLFPIIEAAQGGTLAETEGVGRFFLAAYRAVGVPFTLETLIVGLALVMTVRYTASFLVTWLAARLTKGYERDLKEEAYELAMGATVAYYDDKGSDDVLNAVITQTRYAGRVINSVVQLFQQALLAAMYAAIALFIAPALTAVAAVVLGGVTYVVRNVVEPGYVVGDRVATANENLQENAQAGTQGIREVKLFGMTDDLLAEFREIVAGYTEASIAKKRNQVAISSAYRLAVALTLFGLVYAAVSYLALSVSALGVFLFAMFRLSPRISRLNAIFYAIESGLPHLVRTHRFVEQLRANQEPAGGDRDPPEPVGTVAFEDVSFAYEPDKPVLRGVSFEVRRGEFVGVVGPSGAGKSTVVSLLARVYEPDGGRITADGVPIDEMPVRAWRERVAMVRQDPHIFNDTLRYNLTTGREVDERALERAAETACVTEFLDSLPDGYDTVLGDDGVKLSGGQRQRVALARALLTDAELLVLDEATSDLDSGLEREVHAALVESAAERTVVAIAHRLSTVRDADRILTMESGRVTEAGTHGDLVDSDGTYAELYALQRGEGD